jgi:hypothetical protein
LSKLELLIKETTSAIRAMITTTATAAATIAMPRRPSILLAGWAVIGQQTNGAAPLGMFCSSSGYEDLASEDLGHFSLLRGGGRRGNSTIQFFPTIQVSPSSPAGTRSPANLTSESTSEGSARIWIVAAFLGVADGTHWIVSISSRRRIPSAPGSIRQS